MSGEAVDRDEALLLLAAAWRQVVVAERRLRACDNRRPGELSMAHFRALGALADTGEGMPAGRLADAASLSPAAVTQMLDTLEARGMVSRERSPHDRRVVLVRLTPLGRERLEERRRRFLGRWQEVMSDLPAEDLVAGRRVLERVTGLIETYAREVPGAAPEATEAPATLLG